MPELIAKESVLALLDQTTADTQARQAGATTVRESATYAGAVQTLLHVRAMVRMLPAAVPDAAPAPPPTKE